MQKSGPFLHDARGQWTFQPGRDYRRRVDRLPSTGEVAEIVLKFDSQTLRDPVHERHVACYQVNLQDGAVGKASSAQAVNIRRGHCPGLSDQLCGVLQHGTVGRLQVFCPGEVGRQLVDQPLVTGEAEQTCPVVAQSIVATV